MCYNKEVSLVVFIFAVSCSVKLFIKGDIAGGTFLLMISLMQFVEFILHSYTNNKSTIHQLASLCIFIVFIFQIISIMVLIPYVQNDPNIQNSESITTEILGSVLLLIYLYFFIKAILPKYGTYNSNPMCKIGSTGCRLKWSVTDIILKDNMFLYYLSALIYIILVLMATNYIFGLYVAIIMLALLIFCLCFFNKSIGTLWCFGAIVICTIVIIFD
jgi:hypothetical protein